MKKACLSTFLILLVSFLSIPKLAFPLEPRIQEPEASAARTVWENPWTLTTFHEDGRVNSTFFSFPKVIWNGSQYVDYIFNSSDMSAGIGSIYIKVSPDHTVFYDPYRREERIRDESWIVEYYNPSDFKWESDYPDDSQVYSLVNSSGIYFNRRTTLQSGSLLDVWYWLKIGSKLKISAILNSARTGEYRLVWALNGVSGTKANYLTTTQNTTSQLIEDHACSRIQFLSDNESKCLVDWSDALSFNGTSEKWETCFQELRLQKDPSDDRCQARISFANFPLKDGESVILDPTVATFNSSVSDGGIERYGWCYPPTDGASVCTSGSLLFVGQDVVTNGQGPQGELNCNYTQDRSYVSFDTSSIPALAYNMSATLRLETNTLYAAHPVNFAVQVMGCDPQHLAPLYYDNLTEASWGCGKTQIAAWDAASYPGDDVYVNITIPPDQIDKVDSTEFELKSSQEGSCPSGPEYIQFYSGNSAAKEPKLEVSYSLDTMTIGGETWFYRNVSSNKIAIVLFGAWVYYDHVSILVRSIDVLGESPPEKTLEKIQFLDGLIDSGFSVLTPRNDQTYPSYTMYDQGSTWIYDAVMNQSYRHVFLFGFSGGGVVVGSEIQKDYATRFSAAVMASAPVDWDEWSSNSIFQSAHNASKAKVATCFVEGVHDGYNSDMLLYYNNTLVHKEWHDWNSEHVIFGQNDTQPPYENASTVVVNWYNKVHPPSTPFTPTGNTTVFAGGSYTYSSGTFVSNDDNVSYVFDWGDGTNTSTSQYFSGQNASCSHTWTNPGAYNLTVKAYDNASGLWSIPSPPLTVNVSFFPRLTITLSYPDSGTIYPPPGTHYYNYGDLVSVNATPASGWTFSYWNLDGNVHIDNPIPVNMTGDHDLTAYFYYTQEEGGCPYVAAWNGTGYVLDNNILPESETSGGHDIKDYYKLEQTLVPTHADRTILVYSLKICEFEHEHDYIDQVKLLAVDHQPDVSVAVSPSGEILTCKDPHAPVCCISKFGCDVLEAVRTIDQNYYQGYPGDYLTLSFEGINVQEGAKLVMRADANPIKESIHVQVRNGTGSWQTVAKITPRVNWSTDIVNLADYLPSNICNLQIQLCFTAFHKLDYVGLDTTPQASTRIRSGLLISAFHSEQGCITEKLLCSDQNYAELIPNQQISLLFALRHKQDRTTTTTFLFYTKGHYFTIP